MKKQQNIFIIFLDLLRVKHTKSYSSRYFNEHPHKYNLYGLSTMLSEYGIENTATQITNKEKDIVEIQTPFIAYFGGTFVVVRKVTPDNVSFLWKDNDHVLPINKFIEAWTGVILLAESSSTSIEPNYKEHRKAKYLCFFKQAMFFPLVV